MLYVKQMHKLYNNDDENKDVQMLERCSLSVSLQLTNTINSL